MQHGVGKQRAKYCSKQKANFKVTLVRKQVLATIKSRYYMLYTEILRGIIGKTPNQFIGQAIG